MLQCTYHILGFVLLNPQVIFLVFTELQLATHFVQLSLLGRFWLVAFPAQKTISTLTFSPVNTISCRSPRLVIGVERRFRHIVIQQVIVLLVATLPRLVVRLLTQL